MNYRRIEKLRRVYRGMVLLTTIAAAHLTTAQSFELTVSSDRVSLGESVTVTLEADTGGTARLGGAVTIEFDANVFSLVGGTSGVTKSAGSPFNLTPPPTLDAVSGHLGIQLLDTSFASVNFNGPVATFELRADAVAADTPIAFIQPSAWAGPENPAPTLTGTTVTVAEEQPCTLIVSGGSTSVPAEGATTTAFNVDVTTDTCAWTVETSVGTTSVSGSTGDGTFTVSIPANPGTVARTISVVVIPEGNAGGAVTKSITQEPIPPVDCFTLTVISGTRNTATDCSTSGNVGGYTNGKVVSISANTPPTDKVFDQWTGDTDTIGNVNSSGTTISMDADKSVTATYKPKPSCTLTVSGGSSSVPAEGATTAEFNVDVTTDTCAWTVETSVGTTSVSGSTGDGIFTVTIPALDGKQTSGRTIVVTVTPEDNPEGAVVRNIEQGEVHSETLDMTVSYGDCWQRSGTVEIPGATRVRLVLNNLNIESCCDYLTVVGDTSEEYRNVDGQVTTPFKTGDSIELLMSSDGSVSGSFTIVAVEYEGISTETPIVSGDLFSGSGDSDCPVGSITVSIAPPGAIVNGAQWKVDDGEFLNSEDTATGLSEGEHTVSFSNVSGFIAPSSRTVSVVVNELVSITGEYRVNDVPGAAEELFNSFDAADANRDGELSFGEAVTVVPALPFSQFENMDTDGDERLTRVELEALLPPPTPPSCILDNVSKRIQDRFGDMFVLGVAMLALVGFGVRKFPAA